MWKCGDDVRKQSTGDSALALVEQLRTVADYHAYMDGLPPESPKVELINGGIVVAARPVIRHARYLRQILRATGDYIDEHALNGEVFPDIDRAG